MARRYVDGVILLDDPTILAGLRFMLERGKQLLEPAGAAALAAVLAGRVPIEDGERVAVILSGGNVEIGRLGTLLDGAGTLPGADGVTEGPPDGAGADGPAPPDEPPPTAAEEPPPPTSHRCPRPSRRSPATCRRPKSPGRAAATTCPRRPEPSVAAGASARIDPPARRGQLRSPVPGVGRDASRVVLRRGDRPRHGRPVRPRELGPRGLHAPPHGRRGRHAHERRRRRLVRAARDPGAHRRIRGARREPDDGGRDPGRAAGRPAAHRPPGPRPFADGVLAGRRGLDRRGRAAGPPPGRRGGRARGRLRHDRGGHGRRVDRGDRALRGAARLHARRRRPRRRRPVRGVAPVVPGLPGAQDRRRSSWRWSRRAPAC